MSVQSIYRWTGDGLEALDGPTPPVPNDAPASGGRAGGECDMTGTAIAVADSWLVTDGTALALEAHRDRFLRDAPDAAAFWDAAIALIPRDGDWFPRVEAHTNGRYVFRLRSAPELHRSVVVATWEGEDPWTQPTVKGPDLERMLGIRTSVQAVGAAEAILLTPDGYVLDGSTSALLWWRGDILCGPPRDLPRTDSVTARSVLTLAAALGIDTFEEAVTPAELDGTELWALNALHGIRIVTEWVDGPSLAELPGRLGTWRKRMDALRRPLP